MYDMDILMENQREVNEMGAVIEKVIPKRHSYNYSLLTCNCMPDLIETEKFIVKMYRLSMNRSFNEILKKLVLEKIRTFVLLTSRKFTS